MSTSSPYSSCLPELQSSFTRGGTLRRSPSLEARSSAPVDTGDGSAFWTRRERLALGDEFTGTASGVLPGLCGVKLGLWLGVMLAIVRRDRLRFEVVGERGEVSFAEDDVEPAVTARSGCEQGLCKAVEELPFRRLLGVVGRCCAPCEVHTFCFLVEKVLPFFLNSGCNNRGHNAAMQGSVYNKRRGNVPMQVRHVHQK